MFEELRNYRKEPIATLYLYNETFSLVIMNSKHGALLCPELHHLLVCIPRTHSKRLLYHNRTSQPASVGLTQAHPSYSQLPIFFSI